MKIERTWAKGSSRPFLLPQTDEVSVLQTSCCRKRVVVGIDVVRRQQFQALGPPCTKSETSKPCTVGANHNRGF